MIVTNFDTLLSVEILQQNSWRNLDSVGQV